MSRAGLMAKTIPMFVNKKNLAPLCRGLFLAIGCRMAIYFWTSATLGGNIANLDFGGDCRLIQSVFLLVILGLVFGCGLATDISHFGVEGNPIASDTKLLPGRTLFCSSKAVCA